MFYLRNKWLPWMLLSSISLCKYFGNVLVECDVLCNFRIWHLIRCFKSVVYIVLLTLYVWFFKICACRNLGAKAAFFEIAPRCILMPLITLFKSGEPRDVCKTCSLSCDCSNCCSRSCSCSLSGNYVFAEYFKINQSKYRWLYLKIWMTSALLPKLLILLDNQNSNSTFCRIKFIYFQ